MKNNLTVGKEISLIGKYDEEKNKFTASNILLKPILSSIIEPIYHQTNNLKNTQINKIINTVLSKEEIKNTLPDYISNKYNFISEYNALKEIHNPTNLNTLKNSKLILTYKELFEFMFKINYLKRKKKENNSNIKKEINSLKIEECIKTLPFELTQDQHRALNDILNDFKLNKRMNRLVIGDVGSGKTIVAFLSIYANKLAGYQSAFLAPTEILATQHYENMIKLFKFIIYSPFIDKTVTAKPPNNKEILTRTPPAIWRFFLVFNEWSNIVNILSSLSIIIVSFLVG